MVKDTVLIDRREQVFERLRTNEALEEDLEIAHKRITELENIIAESIVYLEDSESPFYKGIKTLRKVFK